MSSQLRHELPVRKVEVFEGDASRTESDTVFCPHRKTATSVDDCKVCPFAKSADSDVVVCVRAGEAPEKLEIGKDPRVDVAEMAARTPLHAITSHEVSCVHADVTIDFALRLLLERGLRCLPVVDAEERLIGIVSRSDLLRDHADGESPQLRVVLEDGFHLEPVSDRKVSEIMTPCVHALPEDAPVAFAISLLAFESLHEAPIVTNDGHVIGVVTALDVLRWLASRMGYEVPHAPFVGAPEVRDFGCKP